ncbi:hypothetical protein ACFOPX_06660 [Helicobacter baculiformis]|uniref:Uncharacterized protein n=1 Tax=Helicobacter baculiformis TaxID=427351 RepID=A0ABV7ZJ86_9HELI|nr:hypothetical protein [Helicobacter baculiformis]
MNLKTCLLVWLLCLPLLAQKHYWDREHGPLDYEYFYKYDPAYKHASWARFFLKSYFFKPLKHLKKATGKVRVLSLQRAENSLEVCREVGLKYDPKRNRCIDDRGKEKGITCFSHPRTTREMEKYLLNSMEYPGDPSADQYGLSFADYEACSYKGKVQIFGYTWDFKSREGKIELTRKVGKSEKRWSLEENTLQAYRQGQLDAYGWPPNTAIKYLVCRALACHPRAETEVY